MTNHWHIYMFSGLTALDIQVLRVVALEDIALRDLVSGARAVYFSLYICASKWCE